jgi:hypothetical protein
MPLFAIPIHTFCLSNVGNPALKRWSLALELDTVGGRPGYHARYQHALSTYHILSGGFIVHGVCERAIICSF